MPGPCQRGKACWQEFFCHLAWSFVNTARKSCQLPILKEEIEKKKKKQKIKERDRNIEEQEMILQNLMCDVTNLINVADKNRICRKCNTLTDDFLLRKCFSCCKILCINCVFYKCNRKCKYVLCRELT